MRTAFVVAVSALMVTIGNPAVWIACAVSLAVFIALGFAAYADMRNAARLVDEQREAALLAPHAKWLHQHDVDRQFAAIVHELRAGAE